MVEEARTLEPAKGANRRNIGRRKKGLKSNRRPNMNERGGVRVKIDGRMKKLFRKRAREYNSDNSDDDDDVDDNDDEELAAPVIRHKNVKLMGSDKSIGAGDFAEDEKDERMDEEEDEENRASEDDEDGGIQPGITKLTEGCRAFKMAFRSIIKKSVSDDGLGPVLSAHKKLVVEKLAEEESERKVKGEAKKEKLLVGEKGHVIPASYLDAHEKFLIGVATKGVVKLFNAVNKAQSAQKGLNPSRSRDAKALKKRRKEAFFTELGKTPMPRSNNLAMTSNGAADGEGPGWAPLRDNYMLTNSKLKNWDKMQDTTAADDIGQMSEDSSSDDD